MKTNYKPTRGFTLVELLVVIVIIAALAGLTAPMVIRQRKKGRPNRSRQQCPSIRHRTDGIRQRILQLP